MLSSPLLDNTKEDYSILCNVEQSINYSDRVRWVTDLRDTEKVWHLNEFANSAGE